MDYRNGSFYDNQQPYHCTDNDELLHRQHYFLTDRHSTMTITTTTATATATATTITADTVHNSSNGSSKSERQMPINHYHQQNGFRMQSKNHPVNNNECELMADHSNMLHHQRDTKQTISQYGKIMNSNKLQVGGKDHRNGMRPIPMLPSPPSTPPPPLAKIKDFHDSSNKFYQDFQSTLHLGNRFIGNGNINNNNNEVNP